MSTPIGPNVQNVATQATQSQAQAPAAEGRHGWKATVAEGFQRAGHAVAQPFQAMRALVQRNLQAAPAPAEPRISAPTPLGPRYDAVVSHTVGLGNLPPSVHNDPDFQAAHNALLAACEHPQKEGLDEALVALKESVSKGLEKLPFSQQAQFAMSDGRDFMASMVGGPGEFAKLSRNTQVKMLKAYDGIASALSDKSLPNGNILVKGAEYRKVPDGQLGAGNFGEVWMYERVSPQTDGSDPKEPKMADRIAVKISKGAARDKSIDEPLAEARAFANITGTGAGRGADNAVKMEGVLRGPDGKVMIACGVVSGGKLTKVGAQLDQAVVRGTITPAQREAAMLTLMHDMVNAGDRMGQAKGVAHLDFRSDNMLMDTSGHAHVADPGLAVTMQGDARRASPMPSEPSPGGARRGEILPMPWAAPELMRSMQATPQADVWSGGIAFYQMLNGGQHPMVADMATFDAGQHRQALLAAQPGFVTAQVPAGATTPPMSQPTVDLLNRMLQPNPATRPSFAELANDPAFQQPGVGTQATRDILANARVLAGPLPEPPAAQQPPQQPQQPRQPAAPVDPNYYEARPNQRGAQDPYYVPYDRALQQGGGAQDPYANNPYNNPNDQAAANPYANNPYNNPDKA